MRLTRIVGAVVALILAVTMGQALISPVEAAAKPKHDLVAQGREVSSNKFVVEGQVTTFPNRRIKILRKVAGGRYQAYKRVKTKANGKFRTRIYQVGRKKTYFKVVVPATATYRKTQKVIGYIYTA